MPTSNSPAAEVDITAGLVRALLWDQHPDLAGLPLSFLAEGWDNVQFRLGTELLIRLPRRQLAVRLVEHEQQWLPRLAPKLPLPIPAPIRIGVRSELFDWPWSVVPWFEGTDAVATPPESGAEGAERLAAFFTALHRPAPADAPVNPYRGIPLAERADRAEQSIAALAAADEVDIGAIRAAQDDALAAEVYSGPPLWLHGDPHPGNMVVADGRIVAVIDWGDITSGDPASDLSSLWMLLDASDRQTALTALALDDHTVRRARGWGLNMALMLLTFSDDRPKYLGLGHRMLAQVLADLG